MTRDPATQGRIERFLLVALLTSFALVQPLLDLLGKQAEFLVAHGLQGSSLALLAVILALGLPALVGGLVMALDNWLPRSGQVLFNALFLLLTALIALPVFTGAEIEGWTVLSCALVCAVSGWFAYRKYYPVRLFLKVLTPAVLIFPMVFLFASRASPLLTASGDETRFRSATLETSPDLVFLVLDEFPLISLLDSNQNIDAQQFPNFARLAGMSNWYPGATTGAEVTTYAVPEALTGSESAPADGLLPIAANYPDNLFALLQGRYDMTVMETATQLCPRRACSGADGSGAKVLSAKSLAADLLVVYAHLVTPQPWARDLPSISDGWSGFHHSGRTRDDLEPSLERALSTADLSRQINWRSRADQFRYFAGQLERGSKARLFYLHTLLPHRIWQYLPDGRQYLVSEVWEALDPPISRPADLGNGKFGHAWQNDDWAVSVARQRHLLQVRFVDRLLGELLDRLESQQMLQESMLVVMGDHGASFEPGYPRRAITGATRSDIAAVPLFIKLPGQYSGKIITGPARLTDILPTILEVLNINPDWPVSGASIAGQVPPRDQVTIKNAAGEAMSFPFSEHLAQLARRAKQFAGFPGAGPGSPVFSQAEISNLLGQSVVDFELKPAGALQAVLDAPQLLENVEPDGGFVPAHLRGTLLGPLPPAGPALLAVSVNGNIQAITRTYAIAALENRFEALLPAASLRPGKNQVAIFLLEKAHWKPVLQSLSPGNGDTWRLLGAAGSEFLSHGDQQIPVQYNSKAGRVISVPAETNSLVYLAGNLSASPAGEATVVAFLNGEYAGHELPDGQGFSVAVTPGSSRVAADLTARVFAVDSQAGTASELIYPDTCEPQWLFAAPSNWGTASCQLAPASLLEPVGGGYSAHLDFGDPAIRPYQQFGWDLEAGGVSWTLGQSAELLIPLPPGLHSLAFRARIKPFLNPPEFDRQALWILANEKPLRSWSLEHNQFEDIEWQVPQELLALDPEKLRLTLVLPDAASPATLGAGADVRILGIAIHSMDVEGR